MPKKGPPQKVNINDYYLWGSLDGKNWKMGLHVLTTSWKSIHSFRHYWCGNHFWLWCVDGLSRCHLNSTLLTPKDDFEIHSLGVNIFIAHICYVWFLWFAYRICSHPFIMFPWFRYLSFNSWWVIFVVTFFWQNWKIKNSFWKL